MTNTCQDIIRAMQQVIASYNLSVVDTKQDAMSDRVVLANHTTGVVVQVDRRENRVFVTVYEKVAFKNPPRGAWDQPGERLSAFDVDDLISLRHATPSPVGQVFSGDDAESVKRLLGMYAKALVEAGGDVLSGDFSVLVDIERLVNERRAAR